MTTPPTHAELRGQPFPTALGRGGVPPMYANHEEYEAALQARAEAAERALSDLINDLSDSNQADIPIHRVAVRSDHDVLAGIQMMLGTLIDLQQKMLAVMGSSSDSRSSVQIEQNSKGTNLTVKAYEGSPIPGDEALAEFGRIFREKVAQEMAGWAATLSDLAEQKAG